MKPFVPTQCNCDDGVQGIQSVVLVAVTEPHTVTLSHFKTECDAQQFCKLHGYMTRVHSNTTLRRPADQMPHQSHTALLQAASSVSWLSSSALAQRED